MRILLTRPEADARKSAAALAAYGHECLIAPLFAIAPTGAPQPSGKFTALLATSAHALDGRAANISHLPLHVVGERTAQAARHIGLHNLAHISIDAPTLAKSIGPGAEHFLYLAGRERRPELEALLKKAGHQVTPWDVYETRSAAHFPETARKALIAGEIDAVLHFSTRSAALYRALAGDAGCQREALRPAQIAISGRAARELDGATHIVTAATPDLAGLISALEALS
jgi:uroporphyrinogen-III synthase